MDEFFVPINFVCVRGLNLLWETYLKTGIFDGKYCIQPKASVKYWIIGCIFSNFQFILEFLLTDMDWFSRGCAKFFPKSFSSVMTKSAKSPETTIPFSIRQGSQKNVQRSKTHTGCFVKQSTFLKCQNCNLNGKSLLMKCMLKLQVTRQLQNKI